MGFAPGLNKRALRSAWLRRLPRGFRRGSRRLRTGIAGISSLSPLTVCGIAELDAHVSGVTDVLTILDPDMPDPASFAAWLAHRRTILRFHDEIAPRPADVVLPTRKGHGTSSPMAGSWPGIPARKHLLVH